MNHSGGPLDSLLQLEGVEGVCVLSPSGEVVMMAPKGVETLQLIEGLQGYASNPALSHRNLREVAAFYPGGLLLCRNLMASRVREDGLGLDGRSVIQQAEGERRLLVLWASGRANLTLLRMTLDVMEHSWVSEGIDRVFPTYPGRSSKSGFFPKLLGRRRR